MPLRQMQLYSVHFTLPDGEHILAVHTVAIRDQGDAEFVKREVDKILSVNPDAKVLSITAIEGTHIIDQEVEALRARNPDRPLAGDLNLDTANRLLTNPQIARDMAAAQTPG